MARTKARSTPAVCYSLVSATNLRAREKDTTVSTPATLVIVNG